MAHGHVVVFGVSPPLGYSDETKEHRLIRYAEGRRALSEKYPRSKAEAASLRDALTAVTEEASALKEQFDQAQAQLVSTGPSQGNVAAYRSTVAKLTEAMAVQTAAGAKSQALIKGLELKVKELERELARASSCAAANEEHAQALARQREAGVGKMGTMRRQLDSALHELAKANQSICAGALSPVEEDPPVDDGDAVDEPGTPVLSDQEGDDDNGDKCDDDESKHLGAAGVDANAGAVDPVLAAALAGIDAHNSLMFNTTRNVGPTETETEANRGLPAPEILVRSAAAGAQLGDLKMKKF